MINLPFAVFRATRTRRDFITACLLVCLVYAAAWWLDLAERFTTWAEYYEYIQIDELAVALFFAALASAWFSKRRMDDLRLETQKRRVAEQAERLSRMKFRTLFDESLCGNFICNLQGDVLLCNDAFKTMSGNAGAGSDLSRALGERWHEVMRELNRNGKYTIEQLQAARPDGLPWVVMARFALATGDHTGEHEIHGFFSDITELHLAEREMSELLEENRALTLHASQAEEVERLRIAREIHDDMGQYLTAIQLDAATLAMQDAPTTVTERAANITVNARHIQKTVHALIRRLRPVGLDNHGITDAVLHLVVQWKQQNPGIYVDLDIAECGKWPDAIAVIAYRVVQESLTNVSRHAQASRVAVSTHITGTVEKTLSIEIRDNGVGFPAVGKDTGFGLIGMRERIESVKGMISVTSNPGQGVTVRATIPSIFKE